jgi:hypothetical protein
MTREEQIKQEVREAIAKSIMRFDNEYNEDFFFDNIASKNPDIQSILKIYFDKADSILSIKTDNWSIGIVDEKAELTESDIDNQDMNSADYAYYYHKALKDMLKAGYRKII